MNVKPTTLASLFIHISGGESSPFLIFSFPRLTFDCDSEPPDESSDMVFFARRDLDSTAHPSRLADGGIQFWRVIAFRWNEKNAERSMFQRARWRVLCLQNRFFIPGWLAGWLFFISTVKRERTVNVMNKKGKQYKVPLPKDQQC